MRESESRLAAALGAWGAATWDLDIRNNTFRFDEALAAMLDLPLDVLVLPQEQIRSYIHPDDRERVLAEGAGVIRGPDDFLESEFRNVTPKGRVIWVVSASRVVERDAAGIATRMVGSTRDITESKRARSRLEQEMEFNRLLVNASPAFFFALKPDGTIAVVNDAALTALGYEREELLGRDCLEAIVPPNERDEARRALAAIAESLKPIAVEVAIQARDGHKIFVEWRARPVLSETGEMEFLFSIGIDVGERREQEAARQRYAELLAAVNETAVTLLSHHDVEETLKMIAVRAAALTGTEGSFLEMFDSEKDVMRIVAATGAAASYVGHEVQPGQGLVRTVHNTRQPVVLDDLEQWSLRRTDINTSGVHAVAAIPMLSGDEVLGVLAVLETDPTKRISSEQVESLTRLAQLGSIAIDNARLIAAAQREIDERAEAEAEVRWLNAELEGRVLERTAQLENEVGERIRAEEALQQRGSELAAMNLELAAAAQMKDGFLANMSHELRTPLNAVLGMAEVLREGIHGPLNTKQERSLAVITDSGTHLLELINDVLDLSKMEAGKIDLDLEPVDVKAVADASMLMVRETAFRKELTLSINISPAVDTVDADERRLKQILVNLLSNAVKFTPTGGSVGLEIEGDVPSNQVRFTVWDTGIGIPESQLPQLFTPFFQADSGYTRQYAGTGLGLSLVRRFADLHAGSVDVESTIGEGSRFSVVLPWRHDDLVARSDEPIVAEDSGVRREGPVLIIEDDITAAEQIARYVGELGLQTLISDGSEDPVKLVVRSRPAIVILDVLFESTNGWQMLSALRTSRKTSKVPVIMVSVVDDAQRGLAMGAAAYLVKPISREKLESTLTRFLPIPSRPRIRENPLILIAEDNETNIHLLESYLSAMDLQYIIARDGAAAVAAAKESHPDLILMDVQMPVLDGLEATRLIRQSGGDIARVPIIALTALAMAKDKDLCLAAGADDYMTKPVSYKTLEGVIERLLRRA